MTLVLSSRQPHVARGRGLPALLGWLEIVAEGVERADRPIAFELMGCDFAQGYLFARPLKPGNMLRRVVAERDAGMAPSRVPLQPRLAPLPKAVSA